MAGKFSGKVVLVAGGTGGLGRAVSLAFLDEDASVVVTYRDQTGFSALQSAADGHTGLLEGHVVDATSETSVHALVDAIGSKHEHLDVMVNTIGGYSGGIPLWELDIKIYQQMFALNLQAGYTLVRSVVPVMLRQGNGAIVNVAAKAAFDHAAGAGAYAASKAAAVALMDSLAADVKGTGIRVNTILPSIIDTQVNRKAMPKADFTKWPKPGDIARVILFLCSDEAKVIQGAAIPVYGGS